MAAPTPSNVVPSPVHKLPLAEWKAAVPEVLQRGPWCGWQGTKPNGEPNRQPRDLRTGKPASTTDPATHGTFEDACRWYEQHFADPNAGVGVVTGAGLAAIDYDDARSAPGGALPWAALDMRDLDGATYVEISPSGRGYHAFVAGADGMVEFKPQKEPHYTPHQFVTVTGLRRQDAQREVNPAPERFRPLFVANPPPVAEVTPLPRSPRDLGQLAKDLARVPDALQVLVAKRHDLDYPAWTRLVVAPIQGSFQGTALWPAAQAIYKEWTARLPGYQTGDEDKLLDFGRKAGDLLTVGTLFAEADRLDSTWRERARGAVEEEEEPRIKLVWTPGDKLLDARAEKPKYLVYPYVPEAADLLSVGPGGAHKSRVGLDQVLCIATGTPWGGRYEVRPARAGFITTESPEASIQRRVQAWLRRSPSLVRDEDFTAEQRAQRDAIRGNFVAIGREVAGGLYLTVSEYGSTRIYWPGVDELTRIVEEEAKAKRELRYLYVETVSRLHRGSENDNTAGAVFVGALETITRRTGVTINCGHHGGKEQGKRAGQYAPRGASSFSDNARGVFAIECKDGVVRLRHEKPFEDGPRGKPVMWLPVEYAPLGAVYLAPLADEPEEVEVRTFVHEQVEKHGPRTLSELEKAVPQSDSQEQRRALIPAALEWLVKQGKLVERQRARKRGPKATEYALPEADKGAGDA